jgi:hypothetical protein
MGEHFYTYPTVVELRSDRDPTGISQGSGMDRRLQPPIANRGGQLGAQPQTRESAPTTP